MPVTPCAHLYRRCLRPDYWAGIGEDCRPPYHVALPLSLEGSTVLPPSRLSGGIATSTRRYHGRMPIHPSPPASATLDAEVFAHTLVRDLREVRRHLLWTCLGDPISLAIHCIASVGNCEQVHTAVLNLMFQQAKVAGVGTLSK